MAKKEMEKISIEKMDEILSDYFPDSETVDFHGVNLTILKRIPFSTACEMVRKVADACFGEDGEYKPEIRDFALKICCVEAYTNVRLPSDNVEHQYDIVYGTDLFDVMFQVIDSCQLNEIMDAVQDRIDVRNEANRVLFESELNHMMKTIGELGAQITDLFGSVSAEDIQNMVKALGDGVDEGKLVSEVVAAQNKAREETAEAAADGE